ncbi:hypothetical protein GGR57DRAFT_507814 [Xylariaceae sp. FL1272]|nr:hypothetical protein GGR57DRAFT_507814 [Xylariaceae sp. FL1272]
MGKHLSIRDIMSSKGLGEIARYITALSGSEIDHLAPVAFSLLPPETSGAAVLVEAAQACSVAEDAIVDVFPCTALQVLRTRFFINTTQSFLQAMLDDPAVVHTHKGLHSLRDTDNDLQFEIGGPMKPDFKRLEPVPSLEVLVVGGEVPSAALYETWTSSIVHIINAYGPTECCNWSTWPTRLVQGLYHLLPPSLIPSLVIPLDVLPMGLTGKRDRLREWVGRATMDELRQYRISGNTSSPVRHAAPAHGHEPAGLVETALAKSWAAVLDLPSEVEIISSSNFFDLGGDSVIAMRLVSQCREQKMVISVPDIYDWPTLFELARLVESRSSPSSTRPLTVADAPAPFSMLGPWRQYTRVLAAVLEESPDAEREDIYPCTPFQEGIMAFCSAAGPLCRGAPVSLERTVKPGGRPKIKAGMQRRRLLQVVLCSEHSDTSLLNAVNDIAVRPWESFSPLAPFDVLNSTDGQKEIVYYASHAVFDAFTWDLICKQINIVYHSTSSPLTIVPYSSFVSHIRQNNRSTSEKFWSKHLDGARPVSLFPASQHRVEKTRIWDLDIHKAPGSISGDNITDATRPHLAWALVIARFTLSEDVVFGSVLSQRILDIACIDNTMGPCIATVPVRFQLENYATTRLALLSLQQYLIGAVPHSGLKLTEMTGANEAACNFDTLISVFPPPTNGIGSEDHVVPMSSKPAFGLKAAITPMPWFSSSSPPNPSLS